MSSPRLVVIAASAGGLEAIIAVLEPLPADFPAAIALVLHRGLQSPELLPGILARRTRLRVCHAEDGSVLEPGTVYICPPGVHMTAEHSVRLIPGPRLHFVRPNADLMFDSVSRAYGDRAIGVVLSGAGADAAVGSLMIAQGGGTVLAQDLETCVFPSMPTAAARVGSVDRLLAPAEIAAELQRMVRTGATARPPSEAPGTDEAAAAPTKVLLVDDHRIVLDGLRVLLGGERDMTVVASAEDGEAAVRLAAELAPDVVVMDVCMPRLDGVKATRRIRLHAPSTRVVALSAQSDTHSMDRVLRAGASGYLTKQRAFGELVAAIRAVAAGGVYLSQDVARFVANGSVHAPTPRRRRA